MKNLAILGAGGHGKVAADIAEQLGWNIHFFDAAFPSINKCGLWDIVGDEASLIKHAANYNAVFVAIGNNDIRSKKQKEFKALGFAITSLISPAATLSAHVEIGEGVLIVANACVNIGCKISDGVIINTGSNIDHDNHIGEYSHISPGVNLAGDVNIGEQCWVGIGSSIIHQISIGDNVIVGAGTVIINDVPENVTVVGCPARIAHKR
ncbi:acetyltransferase [Thalassotalea sp. SU-HH00458]|uniref:acetyltransferase n=1 Tax=Thalassotalea sp. SU-HH00458 TaxID=3127657 RepID=UPI003106BC4B